MALGSLGSLEFLSLHVNCFDDWGLFARKMPRLKSLSARVQPWTDLGLFAHLAKLTSLTSLSLFLASDTPAEKKEARLSMQQLRWLPLTQLDCPDLLDDAALAAFAENGMPLQRLVTGIALSNGCGDALQAFTRLEDLRCDYGAWGRLPSLPASVTTLTLDRPVFIADFSPLAHCRLRSLTLRQMHDLTPLRGVWPRLSQLHTLTLIGGDCKGFGPAGRLPALADLQLFAAHGVSDDDFASALARLPRLRRLLVRGARKLSAACVASIAELQPDLRELQLIAMGTSCADGQIELLRPLVARSLRLLRLQGLFSQQKRAWWGLPECKCVTYFVD
jgi:hypothetical protein